VPAASGSLYTKIWKGLNELKKVGLIESAGTRMFMAQASGCGPIVDAYRSGATQVRPVKPNTIAKSIAIGNPADGFYALKTLKDSSGGGWAVPDPEIIDGIKLLAETEGIFAETAGGVVIASLKKLVESGEIGNDGPTVAYITGSGLKTQEAVLNSLNKPLLIEPTLASFEAAVNGRAK
ncbi:MAG: pyridoxal-phosphate dependent enzyme, partial [Chloroflexi bacterium]|nr:pyridoxal-phosphate dependent enzyme [Chloroflexota bacterium]